jgi:hypothetical protein
MTNLNLIHQPDPAMADAMEVSAALPPQGAANLIELEARLHVQRSANASWRYHAAGRALSRLREHGLDLDRLVDVEELSQAHRQIVTHLHPVPMDECSSLERLLGFPPLAASLAGRIRSGTATLSDALQALHCRPDFKDRGRIAGAVKSFAKVLEIRDGTPIAAIPARLTQINARLVGMTHAEFGVRKASFDAMKSRIRKAVSLVDVSAGRRLAKTQLLVAWQDLVTKIEAEADKREDSSRGGLRGARAKLGKLIAFCHDQRIDPAQVNDDIIRAMESALGDDGHSDAFELAQATVYAWERLQKEVSGFPQQKLSRLYQVHSVRVGRRAFESLPCAFQAAWLDFEARFGTSCGSSSRSLATFVLGSSEPKPSDMSADDPFADEDEDEDDAWAIDADLPELADATEHAVWLSPGYLGNIKSAVIHAGLLLKDAGRTPVALQDVLRPQVVERLLRQKLQAQLRNDPSIPAKNNTLRNVATCLISAGRLLKLPADQIETLMKVRDKVDPYLLKVKSNPDGTLKRIYSDHRMGPRHKERLAAMANDNILVSWFEMIATLHARVNRVIKQGKMPTPSETNDGVVLVLHALTRCCPLRRSNLARITVFGPNAWLRMPLQGEGVARITVPREYVKNRKELTVELTPMAVQMTAFYLEHLRPVIAARVGADPANPYLFPAYGMHHRAPESLNAHFADRNWKLGGFSLNLHCQRHLAGKIMLDRDPNAKATVRDLLGHKSVKTTERYYTEINELFAQRCYHAHLEQHYAELIARRRGNRTRRRQP